MEEILNNEISFDTDSHLDDISVLQIIVNDVSLGLEKFFTEHFKAYVTVENSAASEKFISISTDGLSEIFKLLLNSIFGSSVLHVKLSVTRTDFIIECRWRSASEDKETLLNIKHLSEISGFRFNSAFDGANQTVFLYAPISANKFLPIYAKAVNAVYAALYRKIILSGEFISN